jgi:hypothetical protein
MVPGHPGGSLWRGHGGRDLGDFFTIRLTQAACLTAPSRCCHTTS